MAAHEIAKTFPPLGTSTKTLEDYKTEHNESVADSSKYWLGQALKKLQWFVEPTVGLQGDFQAGDIRWFANGKLNMCYNALDRMAAKHPDKIAIVSEGDEPTDVERLTYQEVLRKTSQIANALKQQGVKKGDVVTIYMPMIPALAMTMLACTRIGAIHSVVFAGFSAEALAQRISAARCKFLVTADIGKRGGKTIPIKDIVDSSRTKMDVEEILETVFVWERFHVKHSEEATYEMKPKDVRMDVLVDGQRPYCVPEWMDAEDTLFILYTSGSTGKPKGMVHTTGGYALYAACTTKNSFDLQEGDLFACVADCGWITGHTYVVYGPLLNGSTTFMFESTPVYRKSRFGLIDSDCCCIVDYISNILSSSELVSQPWALLGYDPTPWNYAILHGTYSHPTFDAIRRRRLEGLRYFQDGSCVGNSWRTHQP